mmetsp:Transcript_42214/g.117537  ORF Transcript_42214/g.117537 Transcript_42214/m.117537 type:complete len:240 (-) Transcript_42214:68-787(-)
MPGGGCQERQQHGDAGEHRESGRGAGRRDEAAAGMQPLDDEISFISDMAQSTPLEYSECSSIRVPAPGASIADSATSSEAPSGASERGRQPMGAASRRTGAIDDAIAVVRGLSPSSGSSSGGLSPGGATSVLRQLRHRRVADTGPALAVAAPPAAAPPRHPPASQPLPRRRASPTTPRQPQQKRPLVWVFDVTCCPCGSGVAATDIAGGGSGFGAAPTANAEAEEELVATPAGLWMSPA